jgi:pimeloyl-ACP methyl ester carboxylesterase
MDIVLAIAALVLAGTFGFVLVGACMNALFRDELALPTRDGIACFAREWMAALLLAPAGLLGLFARGPRASPPEFPAEERIPVVLVPGFALNSGSMAMLALYLRRCGWRWVHAINNRPRNTTVPILARNLAHHVEELCAASGAEQVDLVGHSMGGIIASYYVNALGGGARVRRIVTLGTPWKGTRTWVFGWFREAHDLRPGGDVLGAAVPPTVPTTSVWSRSDAVVLPPTNSVVPGVRSVHLPQVAHLEMLFNGRAWRAAGEALAAPLEALPAPEPAALSPVDGSPAPAAAGDRIAEPA